MANTHSQNSDYVVWVLKSEYADSLKLSSEPDGWDDEDYELVRHKKYHGIFTSFSNALIFRKTAIDYINIAYALGGINTNLYLTRYKLREKDGDVKFVQDYFGLADFSTKVEKDNGLEISFNSNELEELMKSHETDVFEIERMTSIDDKDIGVLDLFSISIEGRSIIGVGESDVDKTINTAESPYENYQTIPVRVSPGTTNYFGTAITKYISEGPEQFVTVDSDSTNGIMISSNMFWVRSQVAGVVSDLDIDYHIIGFYEAQIFAFGTLKVDLIIWDWDGENNIESSRVGLGSFEFGSQTGWNPEFEIQGTYKAYDVQDNQGISIVFYTENPTSGVFPFGLVYLSKHRVKVRSSDFFEKSSKLSFIFTHDCFTRLLKIITGDNDRFYSKYFGRKEIGYAEDGPGGLIGMMSGFWVRAFNPLSERYKSLQISLKDLIDSVHAVFNTGLGIETINLKQRVRVEELEYFYQNEVVIKLPFQASKVVRRVDKDLFFSGTEFGYQYGGEYESEVGLDEPNTRTTTVTPIRKSKIKYTKISKVRADETGLELTRRKPENEFPEEDTAEDEHNWFLDIKRSETLGYEQTSWFDRLQEIPTGVSIPDNFRSMLFTPLRMLLRHGFVLRSGLEPYYNKLIKYASSKANTTLTTWFNGQDKKYKENDDILVSDLDRSRFLPEEIEFVHVVDNDLMDKILGSTKVFYKGEYEYIPNIYFKFEWVNEREEIETGYLLKLNPKGEGSFTFQKANENLIIEDNG